MLVLFSEDGDGTPTKLEKKLYIYVQIFCKSWATSAVNGAYMWFSLSLSVLHVHAYMCVCVCVPAG